MTPQHMIGTAAGALAHKAMQAAMSVPNPRLRMHALETMLDSTSPQLAADVSRAHSGGMPIERALMYGYSQWLEKGVTRALGDWGSVGLDGLGNQNVGGSGGGASDWAGDLERATSGAEAFSNAVGVFVDVGTNIIEGTRNLIDAATGGTTTAEEPAARPIYRTMRLLPSNMRVRTVPSVEPVDSPYDWEGGGLMGIPTWAIALGIGGAAFAGYRIWKGKKKGRK